MARGVSLKDMLPGDDEAPKSAPAAPQQPAPQEPAPQQRASQPAAAPASRPSDRPAPKYRPKVSFYQDPADTDRVRGAILHTMATEGPRSLSQFIDRAVMAEVQRLEQKHNGGQPFPPVGARELPQGRPMGE